MMREQSGTWPNSGQQNVNKHALGNDSVPITATQEATISCLFLPSTPVLLLRWKLDWK